MPNQVPAEVARAALYQLFGGLLLECASEQALRDIHARGLLPALAASAGEAGLSQALLRMHAALGSEDSIQELRAEHARLFLGAATSKTPPWESVYLSEERMVWQEPAYAVLRHYAQAGLGYDDMTSVPPDHVGRELLFLATLASLEAEAADEAQRASLRESARSFLSEHVLRWVPRFAEDLRAHASTDFFRAVADGLRLHLEAEPGGARACA